MDVCQIKACECWLPQNRPVSSYGGPVYVESGPSANLFSHPFLQHICDPLNEQSGLILGPRDFQFFTVDEKGHVPHANSFALGLFYRFFAVTKDVCLNKEDVVDFCSHHEFWPLNFHWIAFE